MTAASKNAYVDKFNNIVNENNNTYNWTIKMKPVDLKSNIYINCSKEINDKDAKFEIAEIVRMTKYKKDYTPN